MKKLIIFLINAFILISCQKSEILPNEVLGLKDGDLIVFIKDKQYKYNSNVIEKLNGMSINQASSLYLMETYNIYGNVYNDIYNKSTFSIIGINKKNDSASAIFLDLSKEISLNNSIIMEDVKVNYYLDINNYISGSFQGKTVKGNFKKIKIQ
jgi:hypothetical protein